jgi:hypothetical protein
VRNGIFTEEIPHQAINQSRYAIPDPRDRSARYSETGGRAKRKIMQSAQERRGTRLSFRELECRTEVRIAREQITLLARRRREPVAPERNLVNDPGKLRASLKVRFHPSGKNDEIERERASVGFD